MSLSVCPVTMVQSTADTVWALLAEPAAFDQWWDAATDSIIPEGPARPGQQIIAHPRGLGMRGLIRVEVNAIDENHRTLDLTTHFPLGITIHNHIVVTPVDDRTARVSFG